MVILWKIHKNNLQNRCPMSRPSFTDDEALAFHAGDKPGKLEVVPTKPMATQRDLSLAYSPGVAVPVLRIAENPELAYDYTAKGNMVAVISNGTAILGLGDLGALASKPVMEGKSVLFKRFADVNSIDLEVDTKDVEQFINAVRYLGPSFGGINLEDIKAPDCFIIEERLRELMDIPVFHDDQHGTAIISAAGVINAAHLTGRKLADIKVVGSVASEAAAVRELGTRANDLDLVIVDLFLSSGTGLGVLEAAQKMQMDAQRVVLTNFATPEVRRRCADLGAAEVFDKSSELDALIDYCEKLAEA